MSVTYSNVSVENIESKISISNRLFELKGIIDFKMPATRNGIGHYTALLKRPNSKWEVYDDLLTKVCKPPKYINPVILVYHVTV